MGTTHRLGHLPDPTFSRSYRRAEALLGAPRPGFAGLPVTSTKMVPLVDVILDQPAQTCVGHGVAGCAYVREAAERAQAMVEKGASDEDAVRQVLADGGRVYPSPTFIYSNACAFGHYDGVDGSRPIDAYAALAEFGYCGLDAWPDDLEHLGTRADGQAQCRLPSDEAFRLAADQRTLLSYRIENGWAIEQQARQAIDRWCPMSLALQVDDSYMRNAGELWIPRGPVLGGHYVYAVGYDQEAVITVSSYGRGHGEDGLVRVAWSAFASGLVCSDRYAATFADRPVAVGN